MAASRLCGALVISELLHSLINYFCGLELRGLTGDDRTGYGNHGDYVFGWKGDALQRAMDSGCSNCPNLKTQTIATGNKCLKSMGVNEVIDGCKFC
jgi:hypothetical protein